MNALPDRRRCCEGSNVLLAIRYDQIFRKAAWRRACHSWREGQAFRGLTMSATGLGRASYRQGAYCAPASFLRCPSDLFEARE
jgi:hypothetical protein